MPTHRVQAAAEGLPENLMKTVREARGWSKSQMAKYLGVPPASVKIAETGKCPRGPLRTILLQMQDENERIASLERRVKITNCDADRIECSVVQFMATGDVEKLREAASLRGLRLRSVISKALALNCLSDEDFLKSQTARDLARSLGADVAAMDKPILVNNPLPAIDGRAEREIAEAYCEWLLHEHSLISLQLYPNHGGQYGLTPCNTLAGHFHYPSGGSWVDVTPPSERAATVLSHVGIDLSDAGKIPSAEEYAEAGR